MATTTITRPVVLEAASQEFVDATSTPPFIYELWTCESGNNNTNFCEPEYDRLVEEARGTQDDERRFEIYGELEEKLFGPDGAMPIIPIYFYTYTTLERESVKDSFNLNLLDQVDLTQVEVVKS